MRMKSCLQIALLGLVVILPGCIPSLHPLYTEDDLVFEPALVGKWVGHDPAETWAVSRNGERAYTLVFVDNEGKSGTFDLHLLKTEGRLFLDLYAAKPDLDQNAFHKFHLLPVHTFYKVRQMEPALTLSVLKPDWLATHLRQNPSALRHETVNGSILLTASPKDLQAFLIKHDSTTEAWADCSPFTRQTEPKQK